VYIGNGGLATCILGIELYDLYIGNGGVATCILGMEI
jgi:hypothetical protein